MNNHFIKNIEIKNFKCLENFTADGFGRVNLIGGKNNVGKTTFIEACLVNVYAQNLYSFITSLHSIKFRREIFNISNNEKINDIQKFVEQTNQITVTSNINHAHFHIDENNGIKKYHFEFNQQTIDVNAKDFSFNFDFQPNIGFIANCGFSNHRIKKGYLTVQKKEKDKFLNDILHKFDSRVEKFICVDIPECKVNGKWLDLTELGDGAKRLVSIVVQLFGCENGTLFIDELDNGIHYTQLDELWKIILEVSKEQNVQVFATTHSKECIESYARVAKKLEDEEVTFIELGRNKNNDVKAITMNFERFQDEIQNTNEVRGW
jgi:AAA15 family ATPase/GTPase